MKGYVVLVIFSLLIVLLVPFSVFPQHSLPLPPSSQTSPAATDKVFKVKNQQTGETFEIEEQEFLIRVVSCEMAPSSPIEALKAQTVAAYTYYCKQRSTAPDGVFSSVPATLFTVGTEQGMKERWGDQYDKWYGVLKEAADAVKGQQIQFEGAPITACYHAISAGLTESATTVWGGTYPYLQPVDSSGDLKAQGYYSTLTVTPDQLTEKLKQNNPAFSPTGDPAHWFEAPSTTASGFVTSVSVCNTDFTGPEIRTALGLRSPCFTVEYKENAFTFSVKGYGHNVGMSQAGAKYMASQGATYREILSHYYPNTTIT